MYVEITPQRATVVGGEQVRFGILVSNSTDVIDAYSVKVFGLDPAWIIVSPERLSLFPGDVAVVDLTIRLPKDFPSGERRLTVHVQSHNDPADFKLVQVDLEVGTRPRLAMAVDPVSVMGGKRAQFGLVIGNQGNTAVDVTPEGIDPEEKTRFDFFPAGVHLLPGHQDVVRVRVKAPRPWFGPPKARVLNFVAHAPEPTETMASFVQRARIGRWIISMIGLILAAAVFAAVLSSTLSGIVDEASVDDRILNEALASGDEDGGETVPVDPATVSGRVLSATTNDGVAGVQAELYRADNAAVPVASAATSDDGAFAFGRLGAGTYRLKLSGAGFSELWYENGRVFAEATDIEVETGAPVELTDVAIGGRPGGISGRVIADDPVGTKATLVVDGAADENVPAIVAAVDVSPDGAFAFPNVPSPATYQLIVERPGAATERRAVVLGPAQVIDNIEIRLRPGDGIISGRVLSPGGALGGVAVVADDGSSRVATVSLTEGDIGFFALRGLATPGSYTVTISREDYSSETRTISLTEGQQVGDLIVTLNPATGSIVGVVSEAQMGPAGGVSVSITGAGVEIVTTTVSQGLGIGTYSASSVPVPGTYTITFSKPGLVSQVRLVDLDPSTGTSATGVDATLVRDTAVVAGFVRTTGGSPLPGATLTLSSGTITWSTTSAHEPAGAFRLDRIPPGAYTLRAELLGTNDEVVLVNVGPGDITNLDVRLGEQASLTGLVRMYDDFEGEFLPFEGGEVRLYVPSAFPGTAAQALAVVILGPDGIYTFPTLAAPADYIVAVYFPDNVDALDSRVVQTQPGVQVTVPTIDLLPFP